MKFRILLVSLLVLYVQRGICGQKCERSNQRQFQCLDRVDFCIDISKKCDWNFDCDDHSDEANCEDYEKYFNQCSINNNRYLCNDNSTCVKADELCDGHRHCNDDSDEGSECLSPLICPNCRHKCIPTPEGPKCTCLAGFTYNETGDTCLDINECSENDQICDQKCSNTNGSYSCSCEDGYYLMFDQKSCKASGDAFMVFASHSEIRAYYMRGHHYFTITENIEQVVGLDADDRVVYWTDVDSGQASILKSLHNGSNREVIVSAGLNSPEGLAVDWVTGNIYFTDSEVHQIAVCSANGNYCTILVQDNVHKPKGIVVHPRQGKLFWSEWGDKPCICQSAMNGKLLNPLVENNIYWPNGITIDYPKDRLYWVDAKYKSIESVNIDGTKRRTILRNGVKYPYGVAIFENQLYWSDWALKSIESCNKYTGQNRRTITKNIDSNIFDIRIHYSKLKVGFPNPCGHKKCQEICLLSGDNNQYTCACSEGQVLGVDKHSCFKKKTQNLIIVGGKNFFSKIHFKNLGKIVINTTYLSLNQIGCIAYDPFNDMLFVFDNAKNAIYYVNVTDGHSRLLFDSSVPKITSLAYDYVGNNLYWINTIKNTIEVLSLNRKSKQVFIQNPIKGKLVNIVLVPEENVIFAAYLRPNFVAHIDRMNMDGTNCVHLIEHGVLGPNIALFYSWVTKRLYWVDSSTRHIESSALDGSSRLGLKSVNEDDLITLGYQDGLVFWTTSETPFLYWGNSTITHKINLGGAAMGDKGIPPLTKYLQLVIASKRSNPNVYPCSNNNGNCSHICLVGEQSHQCGCPLGYFLDSNNRTCSKLSDCNSTLEFKCKIGDLCIPKSFVCDGANDCDDGEEEINCTNFSSESDKTLCFDHQFRCDGNRDCNDGSDELNCYQYNCRHDDFRCPNGHCIHKSMVCDGQHDCTDGSDENENCNFYPGNQSHFVCANKIEIGLDLRCNNVDDCGDNSDEQNCHSCDVTNTFQCNSTFCVPKSKYCDGSVDCPNREDELDCLRCSENEFKCKNNWCISESWLCDQSNDCGDHSDEDDNLCANFTTKSVIPIRNLNAVLISCDKGFRCTNGQCIDWKYVCDNITTCLDGSDENIDCRVFNNESLSSADPYKTADYGPASSNNRINIKFEFVVIIFFVLISCVIAAIFYFLKPINFAKKGDANFSRFSMRFCNSNYGFRANRRKGHVIDLATVTSDRNVLLQTFINDSSTSTLPLIANQES